MRNQTPQKHYNQLLKGSGVIPNVPPFPGG
jgi:hypothetical protein